MEITITINEIGSRQFVQENYQRFKGYFNTKKRKSPRFHKRTVPSCLEGIVYLFGFG